MEQFLLNNEGEKNFLRMVFEEDKKGLLGILGTPMMMPFQVTGESYSKTLKKTNPLSPERKLPILVQE